MTTDSFKDGFGGSELTCSTPTETQVTTLNNMSTVKFLLQCSYADAISPFNFEGYYFEKGDKVIMVAFGKRLPNTSYNKYIQVIYIVIRIIVD